MSGAKRQLLLYCQCAIGQWLQDNDHGRPRPVRPDLACSRCGNTGRVPLGVWAEEDARRRYLDETASRIVDTLNRSVEACEHPPPFHRERKP